LATYEPPIKANFNFSEGGYSAPTEPNFDFAPPPPVPPSFTWNLLAGLSDNFVAIWAEPDASQTHGRFQVASTGTGAALSIIDLSTKILYDYYTTTVSGRANEALESDNIIDLVTV